MTEESGLQGPREADPVDYSGYQELLVELDDGVLTVTMNRPDAFNAMSYGMHYELANIWGDIARDPAVRVVILTGAGRAFSAGNDLKQADPDRAKADEIMDEAVRIADGIVNLSKPVIAAINGVAVGGGAQLALLSDITVIGRDVKLLDGHIGAGAVAGDHACLVWPFLCGMAKAKYYLFTNQQITGEEAERIGLVSVAVDRAEVLDRARDIARTLANQPQLALRGTKRAINGWLRMGWPILEFSAALELRDFDSPDVAEARAAFKEKREPRFPSVVGNSPATPN